MRSVLRWAMVGWVSAALLGCSGDDDDGAPGGGGCDLRVAPGDNDTEALQTALVEARSNQVICLSPGTYQINDLITVGATPGLTIRGTGERPEDVLLDFSGQVSGDDGMLATGDRITIENFAMKNTRGNGVVVSGATGVVFRKLKVSWDRGSDTQNGAYAVYPTRSEDVLVEDCEVVGASDAGIYVGQSRRAVVRRNVAHGNVIGIEVENTIEAEIYDNEAYDNTVGIFVPLLPNLQQTESRATLIRDNLIYENDRTNFGPPGTVVAFMPPGVGIVLLSSDDVRVHGNTIRDHASTAIGIVGQAVMDEITGSAANDPRSDGFPERIYIHDNTFERNGQAPKGILATLGAVPLEAVVWDGSERSAGSAELCLGDPPQASFRNFGGVSGVGNPGAHSTDTTQHRCTLPDLAPVVVTE
ncbi:MAG: right-handed parallel beta-helix repeat-containing protein [Polyangiaceae bacterium]|nr:right-handed parallel beta-helix repeat-containing protein [Polyangiaceae bacterium]MCW5788932.1 right-handed parallel beta-helix repeat-containing protein [Polyangiaceae bacterium]